MIQDLNAHVLFCCHDCHFPLSSMTEEQPLVWKYDSLWKCYNLLFVNCSLEASFSGHIHIKPKTQFFRAEISMFPAWYKNCHLSEWLNPLTAHTVWGVNVFSNTTAEKMLGSRARPIKGTAQIKRLIGAQWL